MRTIGRWVLHSQAGDSFWMPAQGSEYAARVDWLFYFIFYISLFFFVLIVALMVLFVVRYRRREAAGPEKSPHHNLALELVWSVIPLILVVVIFWLGFRTFMDLSQAQLDAYEVQVTGMKWKWLFTYPNGYVDEDLHVPVDEPIVLVISSQDVIHSLFIPALRVKMDAVPGRYTKIPFRARTPTAPDRPEYVFCAEYCGTGHSDMIARLVVHEPGGFEKWLADASNFLAHMPPHEAGGKLYQVRGCAQCHSVDGKAGIGPTFLGLYGKSEHMRNGETITADENYIRESILEPQARIVAGWDPVMPTYQGRVTDEEIAAIIAYLKTLKESETP